MDGHLNAKMALLDLGNIVTGSPPHSPAEKNNQRGANGASPGRSRGTTSASGGPPSGGGPAASSLRSMSDTRKAKFRKLLDQQVVRQSGLIRLTGLSAVL